MFLLSSRAWFDSQLANGCGTLVYLGVPLYLKNTKMLEVKMTHLKKSDLTNGSSSKSLRLMVVLSSCHSGWRGKNS